MGVDPQQAAQPGGPSGSTGSLAADGEPRGGGVAGQVPHPPGGGSEGCLQWVGGVFTDTHTHGGFPAKDVS